MKDPSFISLHDLFGKVAGGMGGCADDRTERAVTPGAFALGTARVTAHNSRLHEYLLTIGSDGDHVAVLAQSPLAALTLIAAQAISSTSFFRI